MPHIKSPHPEERSAERVSKDAPDRGEPTEICASRSPQGERECGRVFAGPRNPASEIEVRADPVILDALVEELPVRRFAVVVFDEELHVAADAERRVDLHAGARRDVGRPVLEFAGLQVEAGDRAQRAVEERPIGGLLAADLRHPGM
jgi:hypothetical protein